MKDFSNRIQSLVEHEELSPLEVLPIFAVIELTRMSNDEKGFEIVSNCSCYQSCSSNFSKNGKCSCYTSCGSNYSQ